MRNRALSARTCFAPSAGCRVFLIAILGMIAASGSAQAQTAIVSGFVTDQSDGSPLEGATVALYDAADPQGRTPLKGAAVNDDGLYLLRGIAPGRYHLRVSFIGYQPHRDTLTLAPGEVRTITVALAPFSENLPELVVESEQEAGMARITAGHQRIRPEDLELVPAPDLTADLANYLTTLPGIITTGDRGGQFFVRGGEPTQNLVLLDGMTVYQPLHLLGFYSAFPADVLNHIDFYAGGFGAEYTGRLSSVLDIAARAGNNRRFEAAASGSPFVNALRLEGPIVPGNTSFLVSGRESIIDQTGERLYGEAMPFRFGDLFAKVQGAPHARSTLSATLLNTHDRGTLVAEINSPEAQEVAWTNKGLSGRWLLLPRILPAAAELTLSHSRHEMTQGAPGNPIRTTTIRTTRLALHATYFGRGNTTTAAGWDVVLGRTRNDLGGLFQNIEAVGGGVPTFGLYLEPEFLVGNTLHLWPGMRLQWYNVRFDPYLEPRLRAAWSPGIHEVSGAVGLFRQQIVGLTDRRDAASVFTAWAGIPRRITPGEQEIPDEVLGGRTGRALHALLGYRAAPAPWLAFGVEGFYKKNTNLFVGEWTAFPQLTTRLQPANGRTRGFELRLELRKGSAYGFVTYGYSSTLYAAEGAEVEVWYGTERLRYRPGHDRRHTLNALLSHTWRGFDFSLRWALGSGLPYTRPLAFDGFALVDDIRSGFDLEHSRRVIYERPFDSLLPAYHRLDLSVDRTWNVNPVRITLQASAINVYDRRNIFYVDIFTLRRKDQLPFVPSIGIKVEID